MVDGALQEGAHGVDTVHVLGFDLLHQVDHESERPQLQRLQQVLTGRVPPVQRADAHACLLGDLGEGGAGAVLEQGRHSRGEEALTVFDGVPAQGAPRRT
jgi:hypothetical protein